jgi:hypothetical protein
MNAKLFLLCLIFVGQAYAQSSNSSCSSSSSSQSSVTSSSTKSSSKSSVASSSSQSSLQSSTASSASSSSFTIKDDGGYKVGNKMKFPVEIRGRILNESLEPCESVTIPTTSRLRVLDINQDRVIVKVSEGSRLRYINPFQWQQNFATDRGLKSVESETQNLKDKAIQIDAKTVELLAPSRNGWTYGGLAVPYKYHPSGSKSFTGAATLAPYMGYRFDRYGSAFGLKIIGFAGLSQVNVTQNVDGEEVNQSLSAFSAGVGVLGEINKSVQAGVVIGQDRVNDNSDYADNGKTWISLAIAFPFSN